MKKGLAGRFLERGAQAAGRAADRMLSDPRGQEALARAVGLVQRGVRLFGEVQERALHGAGLAAKPDYRELHKQLARLKRKARELSERMDAASGAEAVTPRREQQGDDERGGGSEER